MTNFTEENLRTLDEAIAQGATKVKFTSAGGSTREVEYRSLSEMKEIRAMMKRELANGQVSRTGITKIRTRYDCQ